MKLKVFRPTVVTYKSYCSGFRIWVRERHSHIDVSIQYSKSFPVMSLKTVVRNDDVR